MDCKHCGHETDEKEPRCPECGEPLAQQTEEQGKGMLIAGRVLLAVAILAALFTLFLFIYNNVQNQQDLFFDAIRDFRSDKLGTISALVAFLTALASYLLLMLHDRKHGKPQSMRALFTVARILVAAEGILIIFSVIIGK